MKNILLFLFLCTFFFFSLQQSCYDLNPQSSSCHLCSYDYYENTTFNWTSNEFDPQLCILRSPDSEVYNLFIDSSRDCIANICDGSPSFPYNDLFAAFENIMTNMISYSNPTVNVYLFGLNPHFLYTNETNNNIPFYVFRRMNITITIQPLLCKIQNIFGCFADESTIIEILIKRSDILFFISQYMILKNLRFNGVDMFLYSSIQDESIKQQNQNITVCSENDLLIQSNDVVRVFCYINNNFVVFSDQTIYGLFNLEILYDCNSCSGPTLEIDNCEFINIPAYNASSQNMNSLINILGPSNIEILIKNTTFSQFLLYRGIINVNQLYDDYYIYVNPINSLNTLIKNWNASIENCSFSNFNFFNETIIPLGNTVGYLLLFNFQSNQTASNNLINLTLTINGSSFFNFNNQNLSSYYDFYFLIISGFTTTSQLVFQNTLIFNNLCGYFTYFYGNYAIISFSMMKFLNNSNISMFFGSNNVEFSQNIVDFLILGPRCFFEVNETILTISDSNFTNICSSNYYSLILNSVYYGYTPQNQLQSTPYALTKIFFQRCIFYQMNTTIINTDQMIYQMLIENSNFDSINIMFNSFFLLDVDYLFSVSQSNFSNIVSGVIFCFSYCRDKYFSEVSLTNSLAVFFRAKTLDYGFNVTNIFDNLFVRNITLTLQYFFDLSLYFGNNAYSTIMVMNSVFDTIDMSSQTYPNIFYFINPMLISFQNLEFKNINTMQFSMTADNGYYSNFSNCIFDHGEIYLGSFYIVYLYNCSFHSTINVDYSTSILAINSLFHDNEINTITMNRGILIISEFWDIQDVLIFNCTFRNNTADIYMEIWDYVVLSNTSPEDYLTQIYVFCVCYWSDMPYAYIEWAYNGCWWCGNPNLYIKGEFAFNFTEINNYYTMFGFGVINCTFSGTLTTGFNLEQRTGSPTVFLQNSTIQNIQTDVLFFNTEDCQACAILNTIFRNISSSGAQLGLFLSSTIYIQNSTFQSINVKNQIQALFYFQDSIVSITDIFCENVSTRKGGLFYGKNSSFDVNGLIMNESFSTSGCSGLFMLKGQINITNSQFYKISSNSQGALCFQNVVTTNVSNISIEQGNVGVWIYQGNTSQIYYLENFSCVNQSGDEGVCVYVDEANVIINESQFYNNTPLSSAIYSTSSNAPSNISLFSVVFLNNDPAFSCVTIENTNMIMKNLNFSFNTYQNLIMSSESILSISFCIFLSSLNNNPNSDKETISLINSNITALNTSFEMSYFSGCLEAKQNSFLFLEYINFYQCVISIQINTNSFLNISTSIFSENIALGEAGAAISCIDSIIYSFGNIFNNNSLIMNGATMKGSDIYAENSQENEIIDLNILNSIFTFINGASIYVWGSFNVLINTMEYLNMSNQPSQCLYVLNAINIVIQNLSLSNFSGYSAVEILSNYDYQMNILINSSIFLNCSTDSSGGAISINGNQITVKLFNSHFEKNKATIHGGALFYMCSSCTLENYVENLYLQNNTFLENEAKLNGGGLKLFGFDFLYIMNNQNIFDKNVALVGNNLAGEVNKLKIVSNLAENLTNMEITDNITGVSGNYSEFLVLLFDQLDNFLITENVEEIIINPSDETTLKLLQNIQPIQDGLSNFFLYTYASGSPNGSYSLLVSHSLYSTVNTTLNLVLRYCQRGENIINFQCVECAFGFYSLDVNVQCTLCPADGAFCPGRDLLIPVEGYWRSNENSSLIVKCSNSLSCPDQTPYYWLYSGISSSVTQYNFSKKFEYVCGEGSYGNLCFRCKKNYGLSSAKACALCGINVEIILLIIFNFLVLLYQTTTAFAAKENISRSLMKILINHNNYLNLLTVFKSQIYNPQLDSVLSFNQQISVVGTITDATILDCIIQNFVDVEDMVMMRIAIFSFIPLIIIVALVIVRFLVLIIPYIRTKIKEKNKFSIFFSCLILVIYSFYPKLVSNAFSLLKCISLDNSSRTFLEVDPNIECWGNTHKYYILIIFLPNLLIWCLGWPIVYGLALIIKRKFEERSFREKKQKNMMLNSKSKSLYTQTNTPKIEMEESSNQMSSSSIRKRKDIPKVLLSDEQKDEIFQKNKIYRFLTMEYHFSTYAWDEFFFGTNLLLLAIALESENMDEIIFSGLLMIVFFLMIIVTTKTQPFRFLENNRTCAVSYLALLCTFYCVTNLIILGEDDQVKEQFYFSLIFIVNGMFYLFWLYYFLLNNWVQIKTIILTVLKKK